MIKPVVRRLTAVGRHGECCSLFDIGAKNYPISLKGDETVVLAADYEAAEAEIKRLERERDEWCKTEAKWNASVLRLLDEIAKSGDRPYAKEAKRILNGHRDLERPSDEPPVAQCEHPLVNMDGCLGQTCPDCGEPV